jgi:hypothetical protein
MPPHPTPEVGSGAGFYRFPAQAGTKASDVSPGHAACAFPYSGRPWWIPERCYPSNPESAVTH